MEGKKEEEKREIRGKRKGKKRKKAMKKHTQNDHYVMLEILQITRVILIISRMI
jgi:hypothetical protein